MQILDLFIYAKFSREKIKYDLCHVVDIYSREIAGKKVRHYDKGPTVV